MARKQCRRAVCVPGVHAALAIQPPQIPRSAARDRLASAWITLDDTGEGLDAPLQWWPRGGLLSSADD